MTYTTVGTICPTTLFWCLIDLNMLNNQMAGVQTLSIGIRFSILEESEEILRRFDWPSSTSDTELLS